MTSRERRAVDEVDLLKKVTCVICEHVPGLLVVHATATETDAGCPYAKKSDPASRIVEVRKYYDRFGYWIFNGDVKINHYDYWRNAMRFAKRFAEVLHKDPPHYVKFDQWGERA